MSERKRAGFSRLQNMSSYDDLVEKASGDERVLTLVHDGPRFQNMEETKIKLADMHPFPNHPFRVVDDEAMQSLTESIKNRGVIHPAIVRKDGKGGYQIISGHRRRFACLKAGYTDMPAYVIDVTDDEAVIMMADANLYQRETFLPSEKAKVYRQKSDAIKRHSGIKGKYTITFDANGGTWNGNTTMEKKVDNGASIQSTLLTLSQPTKSDGNETFVGWYDAPEGGTQITADYVPTSSVTIYAHWLSNVGSDFASYITQLFNSAAYSSVLSNLDGKNIRYISTSAKNYVDIDGDGIADYRIIGVVEAKKENGENANLIKLVSINSIGKCLCKLTKKVWKNQ